MGGKTRLLKDIIPILNSYRKPGQHFYDMFVGGGSVISEMATPKTGTDSNRYAIKALQAIRDNLDQLPKNNREFTEQDYMQLRKGKECEFKGYAGFAFSFGAKWLGGWRRDKEGKRDYVKEAYVNAEKQSPKLQYAQLIHEDYRKMKFVRKSLLYCDPPYKGTTKYHEDFNHEEFWQWCRQKTKEGHTVIISEKEAPADFNCIWQKEITNALNDAKQTEKLFIYKKE